MSLATQFSSGLISIKYLCDVSGLPDTRSLATVDLTEVSMRNFFVQLNSVLWKDLLGSEEISVSQERRGILLNI